MLKSDIFLQIFFIIITATIFSLLALKFYPSGFLKEQSANAANSAKQNTKVKALESIEASISVEYFPPVSILIPSVKMNLVIAPGNIFGDNWTLFDDKISWLSTSDTPGRGNVILYGHNRAGLFGDLKRLEIGDEIIIKDSSSKEYIYLVSEKRKVTPDDIDAIVSDKNQLTLYTCDGAFDQKRLVVIALPKVIVSNF